MADATIRFYAYIGGAWVVLDDVQPASGYWGMPDNKPETRIAKTGSMQVTLNNSSGKYSPGGPSALSGWGKGIPFRMLVTYDRKNRVRFRGFVDEIQLSSRPKEMKVHITALDWMSYALKYPVVNPSLLQDETVDTAFDAILDAMPTAPQERSVAAGNYVFPTLFDTVSGGTKAYNEFAKLTNSEMSRVYLRHDGRFGEKFVAEASDTRNGTNTLTNVPVEYDSCGSLVINYKGYRLLQGGGQLKINGLQSATFSDEHVAQKIEYGKNIKNRFTAYAYPKRTDTTPVLIYESERPIKLASNETKEFRVLWRDPTGKRAINAIPPAGSSNTVSLLHFDRQEGQTLPDETGKYWDSVGDVYLWKVDGAPKFGEYAPYFDGSGPTSLEAPHSEDWEFGNGDFTIEYWDYRFATTANQTVLSRDATSSYPAFRIGRSDGTNMVVDLSSNGSSFDIASAKSMGTITINTWVHYAISRSGNNFYTFKNGTLVSSWSSSGTLLATSGVLNMGRNNATYLDGFIDDLRITKGEALYTASFTAPTEAFSLDGAFYAMNSAEDGTGTD